MERTKTREKVVEVSLTGILKDKTVVESGELSLIGLVKDKIAGESGGTVFN